MGLILNQDTVQKNYLNADKVNYFSFFNSYYGYTILLLHNFGLHYLYYSFKTDRIPRLFTFNFCTSFFRL